MEAVKLDLLRMWVLWDLFLSEIWLTKTVPRLITQREGTPMFFLINALPDGAAS
eukprot:gene109-133_t